MKIAVYCGSFNPVHNGHITIANRVLQSGYDQIWMVVSPQNPLKNQDQLWNFEDRYEMVKLALTNEPGMKACNCESRLPLPSYTINTLRYLRNQYPQNRFSLLIGGDNLSKFHLWKDYQLILDEFGIIVYPRGEKATFELNTDSRVSFIEAPLLNISATEIRNNLMRKIPISGMVHPAVENYIHEKISPGLD